MRTKPSKKQKTETRGRKANSKNGPNAKKTGPKPKPVDLDRQRKERDAAEVLFITFARKVDTIFHRSKSAMNSFFFLNLEWPCQLEHWRT